MPLYRDFGFNVFKWIFMRKKTLKQGLRVNKKGVSEDDLSSGFIF